MSEKENNIDTSPNLTSSDDLEQVMEENQMEQAAQQPFHNDITCLSGTEILIDSHSVTYERLPMLEVVFDRFLRLLSTNLRNLTSEHVDITIQEMTSVRFGDALEELRPNAMISVFKVKQWETSSLLILNQNIISAIIDLLLGGRKGKYSKLTEERTYTTIETTLIKRLVKMFLTDLSTSFSPVENLQFTFERLETNPGFASIVQPTNATIRVSLHIEMEERYGDVVFLIPYSTLEPIREKLLQMFMGEKFGEDKVWSRHLEKELWNTKLKVDAVLDNFTMKLSEVLHWKKGSFLPLEAGPDSNIMLKRQGMDMMSGKIGNAKGRVAVMIENNHLNEKES